jgi:hypothetical protein
VDAGRALELAQYVIQFVESRFPSQEALTDEAEGEEND